MYIAMLLLVTFALPSCEVDLSLGNHTLEYRERTAYLCSSDWQDDWYDDYGVHRFQVLRFYSDGTGEDFLRVQDAYGRWDEYRYTFVWDDGAGNVQAAHILGFQTYCPHNGEDWRDALTVLLQKA